MMATRVTVRSLRGNIVPCRSCAKVYNCAMYQSFTRHRLHNGEYSQGTNILHNCDVYSPDKIPGDIKAPMIHGRTSGKQPTQEFKMAINANEIKGLVKGRASKGKTTKPTVQVPQISKAAKQRLVPWQSPQRRSGISGV